MERYLVCSEEELGKKLNPDYIKSTEQLDDLNNIWAIISEKRKLSLNFICKYAHKLSWYSIRRHQVLSEKIIEKLWNEKKNGRNSYDFDWKIVVSYQQLSVSFLWSYRDYIDHYLMFRYQKNLPERFIAREFNIKKSDEVMAILTNQKLSEKFIVDYIPLDNDEYIEKIFENQTMSEDFIKKKGMYCINIVLKYQKLSPDMADRIVQKNGIPYIRDFIKYQNVTTDLILKYINAFDVSELTDVEKYEKIVTDEILKKLISRSINLVQRYGFPYMTSDFIENNFKISYFDKDEWKNIAEKSKLSEDFVIKYRGKLKNKYLKNNKNIKMDLDFCHKTISPLRLQDTIYSRYTLKLKDITIKFVII